MSDWMIFCVIILAIVCFILALRLDHLEYEINNMDSEEKDCIEIDEDVYKCDYDGVTCYKYTDRERGGIDCLEPGEGKWVAD